MRLHHVPRVVSLLCGGLILGIQPDLPAQTAPPATGQAAPAPAAAPGPEQAILQALAAYPVTAPYVFSVEFRDGRFSLRGRVGTKLVHDAAVRIAVGLGYPFRDEIVIDTAETRRAVAAGGPVAGQVGPMVGSPYGVNSLIYPPPLFGRYDDPFFGMEPPAISYPPWWRATALRQPMDPDLPPPGPGQPGIDPFASPYGPADPTAPGAVLPPDGAPIRVPDPGDPAGLSQAGGTVEMTINPQGVATLRGVVPTLADRIAVGQRVAQTPGVSEVINLLTTREDQPAPPPASAVPPPPPTPIPSRLGPPLDGPDPAPTTPPPAAIQGRAEPAAEPERAAIPVDGGGLYSRLSRAIARRPGLEGLPIKVSARQDVAILSGRVPTVYEAMLAFRAAQQTPGVREVDDRLEFVVPDREGKNPLIDKARPGDVEPYLEAQIRRQAGDLAHIDRVRVLGDGLQVEGTLTREEDRPRLDAILRSMPILRGYQIEPNFQADAP